VVLEEESVGWTSASSTSTTSSFRTVVRDRPVILGGRGFLPSVAGSYYQSPTGASSLSKYTKYMYT
jgi:hypothetical protein